MIRHEGPWLTKGETVICFGDSITAPENGYVAILKKHLTPRGITVINAGVGGDTVPKALTRLKQDVIDRKPDAVSIFLGTNDATCGRGRWADEPRIPPDGYRASLEHLVYLCRIWGNIGKFSITPPLWRFEGDAFAEFGDHLAPYCIAAREAADNARTRFVPADTAFSGEWDRHPGHTGILLTTDGTHLAETGSGIDAEAMLKAWDML